MGPAALKINKRIAGIVSRKRGEKYEEVLHYIRLKLRYAMIRSVLSGIRGVRGKRDKGIPISNVDFNLIPTEAEYEI